MNHVLSTHLFVQHRLTTVLLEKVQRARIPAVEIFCARQHLDYRNRAQINELGHWFRESELKLHSLHSPMYTDDVWGRSGPHSVITITEPIKGKRIVMVDEVKRAIEIAETIPFQYLIQHVGVGGEEYNERKLDAAFTALEELKVFGRQRGVEILLENIPNALSSAERLMLFMEQTHLDLNFCLDVGHANLNEGVGTAYRIMQHRIRSTHLHDNDGSEDRHLFPFFAPEGTIDWNEARRLLHSRPEQYPLLLELKELADMPNPFDAVNRIFEKLDEVPPEPDPEERR
jgi:sugar phosphate isomerase/epimerase